MLDKLPQAMILIGGTIGVGSLAAKTFSDHAFLDYWYVFNGIAIAGLLWYTSRRQPEASDDATLPD